MGSLAERIKLMKVVMFNPWDGEAMLDYVHCLCQSLSRYCEVTLVTGSKYVRENRKEKNYVVLSIFKGILLKKRNRLFRFIKLINYIVFLFRFYKILIKIKPNIVHYHFLVLPGLDYYYLRFIKKKFTIILTLHDFLPTTDKKYVQFKLFDTYRLFDKIIVHSAFGKNEIIKNNIKRANNVRVVPFGPFNYVLEKWPPISKDDAKKEINVRSKYLLIMIGSILPYKGHDISIDIMDILVNKIRLDINLIIAGNSRGKSLKYLEDKILKYGLEHHVHIKNSLISYNEIRNLICACDAGIMPYKRITTSGPIHLLQTYSIPVFCSKEGGTEDVIKENMNGIFIDNNDIEYSSMKISEALLKTGLMDKLRKHSLYQYNNKLTWEKIADLTYLYYNDEDIPDTYYWQ